MSESSTAARQPEATPSRAVAGRGRAVSTATSHTRPAARQEMLRESNLSLVTREILNAPEPPSRADVAARTGMTRSTVSRLVDDLLAAGIVSEGQPVFAGGRGRPAVPLLPSAGTLAGLGVEVDIDFMAARSLDLTGAVLAEEYVEGDYRASDSAVVLAQAGAMARRTAVRTSGQGARVVGTGIALPGLIREDTERLLWAPNLGWRDVDVVERMQSVPGEFAVLANEATLAALAVARDLAESDEREQSFIYVSAQAGIGAALVTEGVVGAGPRGWAGELGHVCVEPAGPRCGCGATGCLEVFAGKRAFRGALGLDPTASVEELLAVIREAGPRGGSAREAMERASGALGIVLAGAVNLLDVDQIVLGGDFGPLTDVLRPGIEAELRSRVLAAEFSDLRVRDAGDDALPATTGGALRALREVVGNPVRWVPEAAS